MVKIGREKLLTIMFKIISNEEEVELECDVQVLNEQLIHRNQQPTSPKSVLLVDQGKPLHLYYSSYMK